MKKEKYLRDKKILIIPHKDGGGGAEVVLIKILDILKDKNILIALEIKENYLYKNCKNKENIKIIKIKNYLLSNKIFKNFIRFLLNNTISLIKLFQIVRNNEIEMIYSVSILNYLGNLISLITNKKHIWHIHEMANKDFEWYNKKYDFIIKYFFKRSELIFLSESIMNSWLKKLNLNKDDIKYKIIYNPIKEIKTSVINTINNKQIIIGCIGTYGNNKNQEMLCKVFFNLLKKHNNLKLKLAGEGIKSNLEQKFYNIKKELYELNDYVEIDSFYSNVDILVVPSYTEAWPLVVFEGMKYGAIPIVTKNCGIYDILEDQKNIYSFDPKEELELYKKLDCIITNIDCIKNKTQQENSIFLKKYDFNKKFEKDIYKLFSF